MEVQHYSTNQPTKGPQKIYYACLQELELECEQGDSVRELTPAHNLNKHTNCKEANTRPQVKQTNNTPNHFYIIIINVVLCHRQSIWHRVFIRCVGKSEERRNYALFAKKLLLQNIGVSSSQYLQWNVLTKVESYFQIDC